MKPIWQFLINHTSRPPCRWELRPAKQGEMIWNGVDKRVDIAPYALSLPHWVMTQRKRKPIELKINYFLHSRLRG